MRFDGRSKRINLAYRMDWMLEEEEKRDPRCFPDFYTLFITVYMRWGPNNYIFDYYIGDLTLKTNKQQQQKPSNNIFNKR